MDETVESHVNATVADLRESIQSTNAVLVEVSANLKVLSKRAFWNRLMVGILSFVVIVVVFLGMGLVHESRQADQNLRLAYLNSCDRSNELIARSNEQERTFISALAQFSHADKATVQQFTDFLKNIRGDKLDPIDCQSEVG